MLRRHPPAVASMLCYRWICDQYFWLRHSPHFDLVGLPLMGARMSHKIGRAAVGLRPVGAQAAYAQVWVWVLALYRQLRLGAPSESGLLRLIPPQKLRFPSIVAAPLDHPMRLLASMSQLRLPESIAA